MEDLHAPFWASMLASIKERSLKEKCVLDFGCSTGGFLRTLFHRSPFQRGIGIDVSAEAIENAKRAKGALPLEFHATTDISQFLRTVDLAFSYEVIFLLPDIRQHARDIFKALKPGGVYYAATGCHTGCPLWESWKPILNATTNLPLQNYSLDDFSSAFSEAGFTVSARRLRHDDFIAVDRYPDYFPKVADALDYYARDIVLFRLAKA